MTQLCDTTIPYLPTEMIYEISTFLGSDDWKHVYGLSRAVYQHLQVGCEPRIQECLDFARVRDDLWWYRKLPEHRQTREISLYVLNQSGHAIQWTVDQTRELQLVAVNQNPYALMYIRDQVYDICLSVVARHGDALPYVHIEHRDEHLCLTATRNDPCALKSVPKYVQTIDMYMAAIDIDRYAFDYVAEAAHSLLLMQQVISYLA